MIRQKIVVLPGDGIGPEVTRAALEVLERVGRKHQLEYTTEDHLIGGAALRAGEAPLPDATRDAVVSADAVFLGAVGDPAFDLEPAARRPESGLLALRAALGVFANLRPVRVHPALAHLSPLRPERLVGVDLVVVRELLGGLYFGTPRGREGDAAFDTMRYSRPEVERIAHVGFEMAMQRRRRLLSVDKANVLESSRLWREVVTEVAKEYPDVKVEHGLVDSVAMRLVSDPGSIDVLLTENMFGDILSDEAGVLVGSLGLLPSASLGGGPGLFEPIHGSAPPLTGRDVANPVGAILSMGMLIGHLFSRPDIERDISRAVEKVLSDGFRTADLGGTCGTREITQRITELV